MGRPVTTHTESNKHREKIRRLVSTILVKMEDQVNTMVAEGELNTWDVVTPENLVAKRSELRKLVERATVGREPNLEVKVVFLAVQIAYLHDANIRQAVDKWL